MVSLSRAVCFSDSHSFFFSSLTVDYYKHMGTVFDSSFKFNENTEQIIERGQKKVYLLQKRNVSASILNVFCHSSILFFY